MGPSLAPFSGPEASGHVRSLAVFITTTSGSRFSVYFITEKKLDLPKTLMLNERGGVEAEVTLLHLASDKFVMISGSAFGVRDSNWVHRHLPFPG
jgi:hypothetical protein